MISFPENFVWGAATSAYQIEGSIAADGRGQSIWDVFSHTPGKILNDDTGDLACDHYHRYAEDVQLMSELGLKGYRFSIAWPRILPGGKDDFNAVGMDFYDRLVDTLLAADIVPYITLYHWDLPQKLQDQGGWANRATVDAFAQYSDVVTRRLGDRVKHWITLNEPHIAAFVGNYQGRHAPGARDFGLALIVAHHMLLAHGRAVPVIHANVNNVQVGIALNHTWAVPNTDSGEDVAAARRQDGHVNRWYLDALFKGHYPTDMVELYGDLMPSVEPSDMETIAAPLEFLAVNYYTRSLVQAADAPPLFLERLQSPVERTEMGWAIYPEGLFNLLQWLHQEYQPGKVFIAENGAAFNDEVGPDGTVDDPRRLTYIREHLAACQRAIEAGVPLQGYFVWSLMDNFEWALGYAKRFGIVYVDFQTLARIPKSSAKWYAEVIRNNGFHTGNSQ